jgi:hypothetical protein
MTKILDPDAYQGTPDDSENCHDCGGYQIGEECQGCSTRMCARCHAAGQGLCRACVAATLATGRYADDDGGFPPIVEPTAMELYRRLVRSDASRQAA